MEFAEFILEHDGDDLGRLALARDRYVREVEDFDLALTTLEVRRKLRFKVPQWYAVPSLQYPLLLSAEQCSSTETAFYKAAVAACAFGATKRAKTPQNVSFIAQMVKEMRKNGVFCVNRCPMRVADLTGGMGVDSLAFSQVADEVLYNEMQPALAASARHNFRELGVDNVKVSCREIIPGNVADIMDGFGPDVIFMDPARRASDGRKVFRLEDCQPNVLGLLPELFEAAPLVLLKLSPMADISLAVKQLGHVREVHVVASGGECKELLLILERGYQGEYSTVIYENGSVMEVGTEGDVLKPMATLCPDGLLFEPGKALLKAGAFELPCRYGLTKLGKHTHLYVGDAVPEELRPFGKCFEILEVVPLNNKTIKEIAKQYPCASVTARNIPLTSDQLRKKLGVKDGGTVHIFGVHIDAMDGNYLVMVK
ncbi:MAG: hypothetical protein IJU21_03050 [Bacteroidales bacterium]|nr:hypothetical protein [Bacteroidales bacterium]